MEEQYFKLASEYIGLVAWMLVLVAAKINHISSRKKLTKGQIVANILYAIVGGVSAYLFTSTFKQNIRLIAMAFGTLSGDVLVAWIPKNAEPIFDSISELVRKWIKKK